MKINTTLFSVRQAGFSKSFGLKFKWRFFSRPAENSKCAARLVKFRKYDSSFLLPS